MLASTVQFSTNKQPPATTPPPAPGHPERYDSQTGPVTRKRPPLPQDPTACLRPRNSPAARFPRTPCPRTDGAVLGADRRAGGRTGQRSTLEHHPGVAGLPQTGTPRVLTWLWTGSPEASRPAAP